MKIILGTMTINYDYVSCNNSIDDYTNMIQFYIDNVDEPILDTAYYYGNTQTEKTLGQILPKLSVTPKVATKANPWYENDFTNNKLGQLSHENLKFQLDTSLKNMNLSSVDIFYLHCPDYETPIEETLSCADDLHRQEKFNNFGISNFSKDQMIEVLEICEDKGYVLPTYYQGMYNILSRKVEEIFPILRKKNVNFWGYNPLAGGLLTGKYMNKKLDDFDQSRFKGNKIYQNIFYKEELLEAVNLMKINPENMLEYSLNWFNNNNLLNETDGLIIGVSNTKQLETNLKILNSNKKYDYVGSNQIYNNIINFSPNYYY